MQNKHYVIVIGLLLFLLGLLLGRYGIPSSTSKSSEREILYWVAPMDASYRRDGPGKSPMGMDLIPVYADSAQPEAGIISISPHIEQNLGMRTAPVIIEDLPRVINTVGFVTQDENLIEHIHTYTDGWAQKLHVKTTGEQVQPGQLLFELYSPTLVSAQEEYLLALSSGNTTLINAGRRKLATLGVTEEQITALTETRKVSELIKVFSQYGGVVNALNIREGMYVTPDVEIMSIEDLSEIWILVDVYENQSSWVSVGQKAQAKLPFAPSMDWVGNVEYIYPEINPDTRTLAVRLRFANPNLNIKPNMYANVTIDSETIENALTIPKQALIRTGQGDRVVLALGKGQFRVQAVTVGIESNDRYTITHGLNENDSVVVSGQFLIDSEASLSASTLRINDDAMDMDIDMDMDMDMSN